MVNNPAVAPGKRDLPAPTHPLHQSTYPVAGKTGTAHRGGGTRSTNAWFVGFGPSQDAARASPSTWWPAEWVSGGSAPQAAAPAVANIFNYLYTNPVPPVTVPHSNASPSAVPAASKPPAGTMPATTTTAP